MPETPQDVNPEAPSTPEQAVTEPAGETAAQNPAAEEQETPEQAQPTPEVVKPQGEVDEMGVPYKNRFFEYKRKFEEQQSILPQLIQEAVQRAIPQTQVAPQYTEEQLIKFKNSSENPEEKAWAELRLREIDERKVEQKFRTILDSQRNQDRLIQEQQIAFNTVRSKYSVAFNPDGSPNLNHPLSQQTIAIYNSDPSFKKDGMGLLKAADMAFANYVLKQSPQLAQQTKQLKRQVKKLEKATLVEGSGQGNPPPAKNALTAAKDKLAQNRFNKAKDVTEAAREYLKATGHL